MKLSDAPPPAAMLQMPYPEGADQASLLEVWGVVARHKGSILALALLGLAAGAAYVQLATPVYRSNALILVENSKPPISVNSALAEAASLFDVQSAATAELHILRSRAVIGQVVDRLHLDLSAQPKYLPVVGPWLARHASAPSQPGVLRFSGYVYGNESLRLARFSVPREWEGQRFTATLTEGGYRLTAPDGREVVSAGRLGTPEQFTTENGPGEVLIESAVGLPGAQFLLERRPRLQVIEDIQRSLDVDEEGKQSGVIRVQLSGPDPAKIAQVLNEIGTIYVQQNLSRKSAEAEKTLALLGTMLPDLREQVDRAEARLNETRRRDGTFDLPTEGRLALERSVQLQTELVRLRQERKDLETNVGPKHPSMLALDAKIRAISDEIHSVGGRVRSLPNVERDLLRLSRDLKAKTDLYTSLLTSSQQLQLVKEGKVGNVRLIDRAAVPTSPLKPQPLPLLAFGGTLGLVAGVALAFLRNATRMGIKDPEDVEGLAGISLISTVPFSPAQGTLRLTGRRWKGVPAVLAARAPSDPAVESLRGARTVLQHAMSSAPSNLILITGATPGVGKSFTSVNLAAVMAATGQRVLLIDSDLRKGQLHRSLGLPRENGLSEVISGELSIREAVHRSVLPKLDFMATGRLPASPADLLSAGSVRAILRTLSAQYDVVILDAAALLVAPDAAILAPASGTVLLVARADVTTVRELHECGRYLVQSGAWPAGVIFNAATAELKRYTAGKRYGAYGIAGFARPERQFQPPRLAGAQPGPVGPSNAL